MTFLLSPEHYELLAMFESEFNHRRLEREHKSLWANGNIFQDGQTNELFLAYRRGFAYGKAVTRQEVTA